MAKRLIYIFTLIFALNVLTVPVQAETASEEEGVYTSLDGCVDAFEQDMPTVEETYISTWGIENDCMEQYKGLTLNRDKQYKVQFMDNPNVISQYNSDKNIAANISADVYLIKMPISNADNKVVGIVSFYCRESENYYCMYEYKLANADELVLCNNELYDLYDVPDGASNVKNIELTYYYTTAVYYEYDNAEYVVPVATESNITYLQKGVIYKAEELIDTLSRNSQEDNRNKVRSADSPVYGGVAQIDTDSNAMPIKSVIIISICTIGAAGALLEIIVTLRKGGQKQCRV